jgi:hypothetical protein
MKAFSFGKIERKFDYIKADQHIRVGPGQYFG